MKIRPLLCALALAGLAGFPAQAAQVETPGFLKFDVWFPPLRDPGLVGTDVGVMSWDANYPATPDMTSYAAGLNTRPVFPGNAHDQYGAHLTGWITPKVTDDYHFYLASDDASQFWISSDATEANLVLAAEELGCCKGFLEVGNPQTTLTPVHLVAGVKYAVKVVLKEGGGDDFVQVAMQSASGTVPAAQLIPLSSTMLSSTADPAGASLAITQQPANTTVQENAASVSFSIASTAVTPFGQYTTGSYPSNGLANALGTKEQLPTFYQWFTNGVEVPGANGTNYTITWPKRSQDGMKVKCYVAVPGIPLYSSEATLTVTPDTTAPTVASAKADASFIRVIVKFSEPLNDGALLSSHYTLDQGATVSSVDRIDATTLRLNTTRLIDGRTYTLTINGVQDTAAVPNTIAANTQIQFRSFVYVPGTVLRQKYLNFNDGQGGAVNNLFNDPRYPTTPDRTDLVKRMEYPENGEGANGEAPPKNFFDTMEGWFTPPTSGNYVFFMALADHCWFYLSEDESPANKHLIMEAHGWSDARNWLTSHDYDPVRSRSDLSPATTWPSGGTISLQAGRRYYIQMVHHMPSWAGGHWFASTFKLESETDPGNGSVPKLEKSAIGVFLDPTVGSVSFSVQPTNVTINSGTKATFYSAASGSSAYTTTVTYQWQSAPKATSTWTDIAGATAATYTTDFLGGSSDGMQYRVIAMAAPVTATSSVATVTVNVDNTAPTVARAWTDMTWTNVMVRFSEPVTDTALLASRYQINNGITVGGVTRVDALTVKLRTSTLTAGQVYMLTINGVQDTATPPNTIAANTQVELRSLVFMTGAALRQKYMNVDNGIGSTPDGLFNDARFPFAPDRVDLVKFWEYPANGIGRIDAEVPPRNFFDTIEGYFIPPQNGDYVFFTSGADRFWLYLSEDESPANKHLIAAQPGGWTNPRGWMTGQGGTVITDQRSDTFAGTQWPNGNTITLEAGKRYYMLEIHHDPSWCGADDFSATYKLSTEADPRDGDAPRLTGNVIGFYFDPSGASVNFTQQPQNVTATQGQTATFTSAATGSSVYGNAVFFQWQTAPSGSSTWTDIPGATAATYTTPMLTLADSGKQFRVIASVPPYSLASSIATLTVQPDTTAPVVTAGAMLSDVAGVVDVGIGFNETVDDAVGLLANYSVSPGTITSISVFTNRFTANSQNPFARILKQSVLLKVTGLSGSGTVTVRNVGDTYGNRITSVTVPFTVDTTMRWGVVGGHEFVNGWNAVTPVAPNGWDVYSDGIGAWNTYDEATFVYEQITGDFDKKLRVAYQDGSTTWARAGLIAKEATAFGMDRNMQTTNALAPRYQKCLVYPVGATLSGPGTPGTATWSLNRRLVTGGLTDGGVFSGPNSAPLYPNAWCRMKREGQTFSMYRSDDGQNWTLLGTTTWPTTNQMPATLYVGPDYAPEIGSVALAEDRGTFLAQFRDYGNSSSTFDPQLRIGRDATGKVSISWTSGTLVSSPAVNGTFTPVTGATSPYVITPGSTTFFKVQQ